MTAETAAPPPQTEPALHGQAILREIRASGVAYALMLPDLHTSAGLLGPLTQSGDPPIIRLAREDEGIGIASGLSFCGKRALLMMQYTGLLDSVNALRAVSLDYKLPLAMMVGLLGHDPEKPPHESPRYGVRVVTPILDAMGIQHHTLYDDRDLGKIRIAIDSAYDASKPVAILLARSPVLA
jgi:sulfopyruvate decarboxylase TPP-binding subunit